MHDNQPYNKLFFDHTLRKKFAENEAIVFADVSHAFRSVAVVGMLLPDFNMSNTQRFMSDKPKNDSRLENGIIRIEDLWYEDVRMLRKTLSTFSEAGIPLHPHVQFYIYNLLPPISSNFLYHAVKWFDGDFPKADLVVVNYIIKHGITPDWGRDYNTYEGFSELTAAKMCEIDGNNKLVSVCSMHRIRDIWPTASLSAII